MGLLEDYITTLVLCYLLSKYLELCPLESTFNFWSRSKCL